MGIFLLPIPSSSLFDIVTDHLAKSTFLREFAFGAEQIHVSYGSNLVSNCSFIYYMYCFVEQSQPSGKQGDHTDVGGVLIMKTVGVSAVFSS